jgi:hypothetical protein
MGRPSTLSADAKDALARAEVVAPHCRAALQYGLLYYGVDRERRMFRTQRAALARLAWSQLEDRKDRPIRKIAGTRLYRVPTYEIDVAAPPGRPAGGARCDRRMELRGAFLACGSLAMPAHGYHLEFVPPDDAAAQRLTNLLRSEGLAPKRTRRKARDVVYFKDMDAIAQVLASIGATQAMLHVEDVRAYKETKNRIRRLVNTEAANVDRATSAAAVQREAIALVADARGLRSLSPVLREAAELRLAHPTETLAELGRRCNPAVLKSTLNGRIAALLRMARQLDSKVAND